MTYSRDALAVRVQVECLLKTMIPIRHAARDSVGARRGALHQARP